MKSRILEASYTSPSGKEAVFKYETVSRETELKTGIFTFPGRDGALVQHQGMGARSFPLACIFSGNNYMDDADAFEAMLIERGAGELRHPYGVVKVTPTGNIKRDDDLVSGIGQSVITVTFTETITDDDAVAAAPSTEDKINGQYDTFADAAAADFAEGIDTDNINEQLQITSSLETQTQTLTSRLQSFARQNKSKFAAWMTSAKELKASIQNLYKKGKDIAGNVESVYVKGLNIARLTLRILKTPSDIAISVSEKIKGYSKITQDLINQYKNDPFGAEKIKRAYAPARLALTGTVAAAASGSALSIAESRTYSRQAQSGGASSSGGGGSGAGGSSGYSSAVTSREEVVNAAVSVVSMLEAVMEFSDTKTAQDAFIDSDSAAYMALSELTQNSVQLILNAAFALPMRRTIKLDRDRQAIELCAELYGVVDNETVDRFILENKLTLEEIVIIPMGREVSYYVQTA